MNIVCMCTCSNDGYVSIYEDKGTKFASRIKHMTRLDREELHAMTDKPCEGDCFEEQEHMDY